MIGQVFVIIGQGRILGELFGDVGMATEEFAELAIVGFVVAAHAGPAVFMTIVAGFLVHEGVGILFELTADCGMLLQIGLQRRVSFNELRVVYERRILANLLG